MPKDHVLKCWPQYFAALRKGTKTFEVRKDDRGGFHPGDTLTLEEWNPDAQAYTGASLIREVSYVMSGGQFGVEPGYVVLALHRPR